MNESSRTILRMRLEMVEYLPGQKETEGPERGSRTDRTAGLIFQRERTIIGLGNRGENYLAIKEGG